MNNRDQSLDIKEKEGETHSKSKRRSALSQERYSCGERERERENEDRSLLINKYLNFKTLFQPNYCHEHTCCFALLPTPCYVCASLSPRRKLRQIAMET